MSSYDGLRCGGRSPAQTLDQSTALTASTEIELEIVDEEEWEAIELVLSQCHPSQQARPATPLKPAVADAGVSDDDETVIITNVTRTDDPVAFIELDCTHTSEPDEESACPATSSPLPLPLQANRSGPPLPGSTPSGSSGDDGGLTGTPPSPFSPDAGDSHRPPTPIPIGDFVQSCVKGPRATPTVGAAVQLCVKGPRAAAAVGAAVQSCVKGPRSRPRRPPPGGRPAAGARAAPPP
jgi:hypothetical protein